MCWLIVASLQISSRKASALHSQSPNTFSFCSAIHTHSHIHHCSPHHIHPCSSLHSSVLSITLSLPHALSLSLFSHSHPLRYQHLKTPLFYALHFTWSHVFREHFVLRKSRCRAARFSLCLVTPSVIQMSNFVKKTKELRKRLRNLPQNPVAPSRRRPVWKVVQEREMQNRGHSRLLHNQQHYAFSGGRNRRYALVPVDSQAKLAKEMDAVRLKFKLQGIHSTSCMCTCCMGTCTIATCTCGCDFTRGSDHEMDVALLHTFREVMYTLVCQKIQLEKQVMEEAHLKAEMDAHASKFEAPEFECACFACSSF
jgi:hypothetical protein